MNWLSGFERVRAGREMRPVMMIVPAQMAVARMWSHWRVSRRVKSPLSAAWLEAALMKAMMERQIRAAR